MHLSSHPPRSRWHRVLTTITLVAFALIPLLGVAHPARALSSHCTTTIALLERWEAPGEDQVVSSQELDVLRSLIEAFDTCQRAIPGRPDTRPTSGQPASVGYSGMGDDHEQWRSLAASYFESTDIDRVICLIEHESGGNPLARNERTGAAGLLQVMPFWADAVDVEYEELFEPEINLWLARHILELQGWNAWSPYQRGACR